MYFMEEKHTRWGHDRENCRINVIRVPLDSPAHESAVSNSKLHKEDDDDEEEEEEGMWYDDMIKNIMRLYKIDNLPIEYYKELWWVDRETSGCGFEEYANLKLWSYKNANCNIMDHVTYNPDVEDYEKEKEEYEEK